MSAQSTTANLAALVICAGALLVSGCSREPAATENSAETSAVAIFTTSVREEAIVEAIQATGEIIADKSTEITPRVDGVIDEIYVRVGDKVSRGYPLFMTRPTEYKNRVIESEQTVALAEAELAQSIREFKRNRALRERDVVSQGRLDAVSARYNVAKARLGIAQASLIQTRQNLDDTIVKAPYAGVVTGRYVDEGKMVRTAMAGSPIVEIVKIDIVEVIVRIPAVHLARLSANTRAKIDVGGRAQPIESVIHVINDKVDARTRTIEIRLRLENADFSLKPGMFAKVTLFPKSRSAVIVERAAVLGISGDQYVFVSNGGVARRRAITARDVDARLIEVLAGLSAGQKVLTGPNLPDISDGTPVQLLAKLDAPR